MAISFSNYIDITSGVAGSAQLAGRNFGGRIFTNNPLLPPESYLESDDAAGIGDYFGTASSEYKRTSFYFDFISKNITKPTLISFARWVDEDVAPMIFGKVQTQLVANYSAISNGSFEMTIGGVANTFTGLDFSGALSLADVASIIQTAIRTKTGSMWTAAIVTFDAVRGSFNFEGGQAVAAVITVANMGTGTSILPLLGWLTGAIIANGALAETITDTLQNSWDASNNFGSFIFMPTLTLDQIVEASAWTSEMDVSVMYFPRVAKADAATYYNALKNYGGVGVTVAPLANEYPEQSPMMVFAATDYTKVNATQNYMYQQFNLTPSISTNADQKTMDQNRINYYGNTQNSGKNISFYQRGVLMGLPTSPTIMTPFANEIWLKDAMGVALMNLQLALSQVAANKYGLSQLFATSQTVVDQAVNNGTISVGKTLTNQQKLTITQISGDGNAWQQVQNIGYWINWVITPYVNPDNNLTEYEAVYTLIYSKNDVVNKVIGRHVLI